MYPTELLIHVKENQTREKEEFNTPRCKTTVTCMWYRMCPQCWRRTDHVNVHTRCLVEDCFCANKTTSLTCPVRSLPPPFCSWQNLRQPQILLVSSPGLRGGKTPRYGARTTVIGPGIVWHIFTERQGNGVQRLRGYDIELKFARKWYQNMHSTVFQSVQKKSC